MEILFTGNKPQKKTYSYSVKENNNANIITFILDKVQEGLDLSTLSCFVKVQGLEIDKDVPTIEIEGDQIKVNWTLLRKHTISRMLLIQLQFEGTSDIVWQTEIITIVLSDTIKADKYIENEYPAVLTNHEERITDLEDGAVSDPLLHQSDIVDNLESEATKKPLSANQGRVLNNKINTAISGVMHYKGSVATYDDLPTENLEVGDLYNVIEDDSNYAWTGSKWDPVGSSVDLSNYYDKGETNALLENKADTSDLDNYALLEQGFNVIKATDIVNNTLTQDQYNLITNGKPTLIKGKSVLGDDVMCLRCSKTGFGGDRTMGAYFRNIDGGIVEIRMYGFNNNSKELKNFGAILSYNQNGNVVKFEIDTWIGKNNGTGDTRIKGKIFPNYPSSPSTSKVLTYDTDNTLKWGDGIFNVINASDITNNLTQEQISILANGKPTRIEGDITISYYAFHQLILYKWGELGSLKVGHYEGYFGNYCEYVYGTYQINQNGTITLMADTSACTRLRNISHFNGKQLPTYPTDTTKQYKLVQKVGGNLDWVEDN